MVYAFVTHIVLQKRVRIFILGEFKEKKSEKDKLTMVGGAQQIILVAGRYFFTFFFLSFIFIFFLSFSLPCSYLNNLIPGLLTLLQKKKLEKS